jgi:hypothetical protein
MEDKYIPGKPTHTHTHTHMEDNFYPLFGSSDIVFVYSWELNNIRNERMAWLAQQTDF